MDRCWSEMKLKDQWRTVRWGFTPYIKRRRYVKEWVKDFEKDQSWGKERVPFFFQKKVHTGIFYIRSLFNNYRIKRGLWHKIGTLILYSVKSTLSSPLLISLSINIGLLHLYYFLPNLFLVSFWNIYEIDFKG